MSTFPELHSPALATAHFAMSVQIIAQNVLEFIVCFSIKQPQLATAFKFAHLHSQIYPITVLSAFPRV